MATTGILAGSTLGSAALGDLGLLSAGMSAYGSYQQGQAQSDMYKYQAGIAQQQNDLQNADVQRQAKRLASTQAAQYGAMGIDLSGGSAANAISQTAYDGALNIFDNNYNTNTRVASLNNNAATARSTGTTKAATTLLNFGYSAGQKFS